MHKPYRTLILALLCIVFVASSIVYTQAAPLGQTYTPPTTITVHMYALDTDTSDIIEGEECGASKPNATEYGCSFASDQPYPYTSNPVTINKETISLMWFHENRILKSRFSSLPLPSRRRPSPPVAMLTTRFRSLTRSIIRSTIRYSSRTFSIVLANTIRMHQPRQFPRIPTPARTAPARQLR